MDSYQTNIRKNEKVRLNIDNRYLLTPKELAQIEGDTHQEVARFVTNKVLTLLGAGELLPQIKAILADLENVDISCSGNKVHSASLSVTQINKIASQISSILSACHLIELEQKDRLLARDSEYVKKLELNIERLRRKITGLEIAGIKDIEQARQEGRREVLTAVIEHGSLCLKDEEDCSDCQAFWSKYPSWQSLVGG